MNDKTMSAVQWIGRRRVSILVGSASGLVVAVLLIAVLYFLTWLFTYSSYFGCNE